MTPVWPRPALWDGGPLESKAGLADPAAAPALQHSEAMGLLGLLVTTALPQHGEALFPDFLRKQAVKMTFVKTVL